MVLTALQNKGTDGVSPPNSFYDIARALTRVNKRSQLLLPTLNREPNTLFRPIMHHVRSALCGRPFLIPSPTLGILVREKRRNTTLSTAVDSKRE